MSQVNRTTELAEAPSPSGDMVAAIDAHYGAGGGLQQVRSQFTTAIAVQRPRNMQAVVQRCLDEARLMGPAAYYAWGEGKDHIEGATQELAYAAARLYGNVALEMQPVQITNKEYIFTAVFIDLETGFTLPRQFRQSREWKVFGKHDPERKEDIRFQIGQSKAQRNVIIKALPGYLIEAMLMAAKDSVTQKIRQRCDKEGLPAVRDAAIKKIGQYGVKPEWVLERLGVASLGGITPEHIAVLSSHITSLERKDATVEELYGEQIRATEARQKADAAAAKDPQAEGAPPPPPERAPSGRTKGKAGGAPAEQAGGEDHPAEAKQAPPETMFDTTPPRTF